MDKPATLKHKVQAILIFAAKAKAKRAIDCFPAKAMRANAACRTM
jgi:hypothetical protein